MINMFPGTQCTCVTRQHYTHPKPSTDCLMINPCYIPILDMVGMDERGRERGRVRRRERKKGNKSVKVNILYTLINLDYFSYLS